LPNVNIVVSIYLSVKSQTFKVHREHGISDTTGDIELYEKYGISYIDQGYHPWGESSRIYQRPLENVSPQMNDAK
jgi:hypothetical protein